MQNHLDHSDEHLRMAILTALAADSRTTDIQLHLGVQNGIVHLAGVVDSLQNRAAAEELAMQVPGVRGVVNRIDAPGAPSPARTVDLHLCEAKKPYINRKAGEND